MVDLISFNRVVPVVNQIETNLYCQRQEEHGWLDKYEVQHMALATKYGKTPAQILLRFMTQQNVVVIPKSVHEERIEENINIFDFSLTEEELQSIRALDKKQPMIGRAENPDFVEMAMKW